MTDITLCDPDGDTLHVCPVHGFVAPMLAATVVQGEDESTLNLSVEDARRLGEWLLAWAEGETP